MIDPVCAEHKRLFDEQIQKRMVGVFEKSQFLPEETYACIVTCLQTWGHSGPPTQGKEEGSSSSSSWRPRVQLGQEVCDHRQPVLFFPKRRHPMAMAKRHIGLQPVGAGGGDDARGCTA